MNNVTRKEKDSSEKSKGMVVIPYIKGVTEQLQWVYKKYKISTSFKLLRTIRNALVDPKDQVKKGSKSGVVYRIKCKNCVHCYTGETGRQLKTKVKVHRTEVDTLPSSSHP